MNSISIVGNLVADCKRELTNSDKKVAIGRVAVNGRHETSYIDVKAWEKRAEFLANNFGKGSRVAVTGELRQDVWTAQDGSKRSRTYILANRIDFAGGRPSAAPATATAPASEPAPVVPEPVFPEDSQGFDDDNDIPF
jgi:single-strand DNA-binding protein